MRGIVNPRAVLLDLDFPLKIAGHAFEFGGHALDLHELPPLFIHLELLQTDDGIA